MATPPVLTQAEYIALLDSLPVHPSCLFYASLGGDVEEVKRILMNNPNLDVSWTIYGRYTYTALYVACENDRDSIVSILLAHPAIDVNLKAIYGTSPFFVSGLCGMTSCVRLLLKDQSVEVNEPDNGGCTPLCWAARKGHLDVIKWWIASGRETDLGTPGDAETDAIGEAKRKKRAKVVTLLEKFQENPEETRHLVRVELGWYDEAAVEIFALMVFVSDELLQLKVTTPTPATRFFSIARRLPLELQMIICHRVVGSPKEIIRAQDSESAFKSLAERLLWSSIFTSG